MFYGDAHILERRRMDSMGDRGTIINVISWVLLAVVVCTLVARFAMKLTIKSPKRRCGLDDFFISCAALFSVGQTVVVSIEAMEVLGQHERSLTPRQTMIFQKLEYAACILYIANMGCARISVCLLISKILPGSVPKYTSLAFALFTALWTISGVLTTAFACSLPQTWTIVKGEHCVNVVAFVNYIGITNIVVDVILVLIPLVVWNLRISASKQVSVSLVFLARLSVVAAVAAQLYFFNRKPITDFSYDAWPNALCQQIAQNLAVISACLPYLHPFIRGILAGTTKPESISFGDDCPPRVKRYLRQKTPNFDPTSSQDSQSSTLPINEKSPEVYCRPLATHGLIRSSTHLHSNSATRIPVNTAKPIFTSGQPESFFNRWIDVPQSRPQTSSSTVDPLSVPKDLGNVGVLPIIDWDTESSNSGGSRRNSPARQPTAEYIFNRQKVISVPEENQLYDEGVKKFAPPLPSPKMPRRPPRAF